MSYGKYQVPPVTDWRGEQFDLAAYSQQLSYPQLLAPGRPRPERAVGGMGGLVHAVRGIRRHRLVIRDRV
jgi:hypothetical protein